MAHDPSAQRAGQARHPKAKSQRAKRCLRVLGHEGPGLRPCRFLLPVRVAGALCRHHARVDARPAWSHQMASARQPVGPRRSSVSRTVQSVGRALAPCGADARSGDVHAAVGQARRRCGRARPRTSRWRTTTLVCSPVMSTSMPSMRRMTAAPPPMHTPRTSERVAAFVQALAADVHGVGVGSTSVRPSLGRQRRHRPWPARTARPGPLPAQRANGVAPRPGRRFGRPQHAGHQRPRRCRGPDARVRRTTRAA